MVSTDLACFFESALHYSAARGGNLIKASVGVSFVPFVGVHIGVSFCRGSRPRLRI